MSFRDSSLLLPLALCSVALAAAAPAGAGAAFVAGSPHPLRPRVASAPVAANSSACGTVRPTAGLFAPGEKVFGKTQAEWEVERFRRWLSIPHHVNPVFDDPLGLGTQCGIGQQGPVWFLDSLSCSRVANGKAILIPIAWAWNDYPCPDPTFEPAPGQTLEDFLRDGIAGFLDTFELTEVSLDGVPIADPGCYRQSTRLHGFTAAANLVDQDPCLTGSPELEVTDAYVVMLKPPRAGDHVLHVVIGPPPVFEFDFHFTVLPD